MPHELHTNRLIIRPGVAADGDAVVTILNNLDVSRWLVPVAHPFTHTDLRILNEDGSSRWPELAAITLQGRLIGGIGMGTHIGYYLAPDVWGKGYGTESAKAAVTYSFDNLQVETIQSGCFVDNIASFKILSGLGFRKTGSGFAYCAALKTERAHYEMALEHQTWKSAA